MLKSLYAWSYLTYSKQVTSQYDEAFAIITSYLNFSFNLNVYVIFFIFVHFCHFFALAIFSTLIQTLNRKKRRKLAEFSTFFCINFSNLDVSQNFL